MRVHSLAHWHPEPEPLGPRLLRPGQAAAYVGISTPMLARYRLQEGGPDFVWFGAKCEPRYTREGLDAWIARRKVTRPTIRVPALVPVIADTS